MKKFKKFWRLPFDSIQEPLPHHTVLCLTCGTLYNRKTKIEKKCKFCEKFFNKNKLSEFYVAKNKIYFGKDLEERRKVLGDD
jgi:hypothetical protein